MEVGSTFILLDRFLFVKTGLLPTSRVARAEVE
jgi:hypothetical protein